MNEAMRVHDMSSSGLHSETSLYVIGREEMGQIQHRSMRAEGNIETDHVLIFSPAALLDIGYIHRTNPTHIVSPRSTRPK